MEGTITMKPLSWDLFIDSYDKGELAKQNLKREEKSTADILSMMLVIISLPLLAYLIIKCPLFAGDTDANNDIMYVIDSPLLRGRNDLVARYSTFVSFLAQCIITACGFCIIALKTVTISMTLLYLTHPMFWDRVSDAKQMFKERGEAGDWLSTIVSYFTPDVRKYSEYGDVNSDDRMYDIGGIQTIGSYVKKNAIQFIVLMTLASILWSGKLLKLVGAVSQGCVAVVDWALQIDYSGKVTGMLEADRDFQFHFDKNTTKGKNQTKVAQSIYSQVKTAVSDNRTSKFLNDLGEKVQKYVGETMSSKGSLAGKDQAYIKWDNPTLTFSVTWNSSKPQNMKEDLDSGVWSIPMSKLFDATGDEVSTKQQELNKNGVVYVTFSAQKMYSDYDLETKNKQSTTDK